MTIDVIGPDGVINQFPEGTSDEVIKQALSRQYGTGKDSQAARASALKWAADKTGVSAKRSAWDRFGDNFSNTLNTNLMAEFGRSRFTNPLLGLAPSGPGIPRARPHREIKSFKDVLGALAGDAVDEVMDAVPAIKTAGAALSVTGLVADKVAPGLRQKVVQDERQRRADFAAKSKADPFYKAGGGLPGKAVHGSAALLGVLSGTALDPTSYVSAGESLLARALVQGGIAAGADLLGQTFAQDGGVQDEIDMGQTALSGIAGAGFTGIIEGGAKLAKGLAPEKAPRIPDDAPVDAHFKAELDAADLISKLTLTARDLPDLRAANDNVSAEVAPRPAGPSQARGERVGANDNGGPQGGTTAEGDPWAHVDWASSGSEGRKLAAAAHLETLRRTIKPEHAQAFGQWVARGARRLLGDSAHARVNPDWVDWDRLSSNPDEFLSLEAALQDFFKDTFEAAGTKAQSWDVTRSAAKVFGAKLSDITTAHGQIVGARGEAGVAAKLVALQSVADAHADRLAQHINAMRARVGRGEVMADDIAKLAAGVQEATLMDAMAAGSSSEIGRALNVLKMARQARRTTNDMAAALDFLRESMGGNGEVDPSKLGDILDRMSGVYRQRGTAGLKDEIRKAREVGFWDYAGYLITGGLLSAPKSFIRNVLGSGLFLPLNVLERYTAAGIGAVRTGLGRGGPERVTFREANAYAAGVRSSFVDAMRAAVSAFQRGGAEGPSSVLPTDRTGFVPFKMTPERWSRWRARPVSSLPEMLGWGVFSATRSFGFRPTIAMDEFTRTMGRQMQLSALAVREAHYRAAREADPEVASKVFSETLEAIREEPTAEAVKMAREFFEDTGQDQAAVYGDGSTAETMARILTSIDVRKLVEDHAQDLAFQRVGPVATKVDAALRAIPALKYFYAPFFRTPVALLKAGLLDRTPLALALRENRDNLAQAARSMSDAMDRGGADADLALAKMTVGAGVMALAFSLWEQGALVGGRGDHRNAERLDGVRPYSIKLGDTWVDFSPLSPLAEPFGLVADLASILADRQLGLDDGEAAVGAVLAAISNSILNKTMLQGLHQLNSTLFGDVPGEGAESRARGTSDNVAQTLLSAVPLSSLLRSTAQEIDPVRREAHGLLEKLQAMTPGLSERLPAMRDVFGRPLVRSEGETGAFQALNTSERSGDIMMLELSRLGRTADLSITRPPRTFNDERLEPAEYARVLEVQGQLWRHPRTGMNMEEAVRDMMQTDEYASWGDDHRAYEIKQLISKYRTLANRAIRSPASPFYLPDMVRRTGRERLRKEALSRGLSPERAALLGRRYGVSRTDAMAEIEQMRKALDLDE